MRKLFALLFFALFLAPAPLGARPFSRGRIVVHPGGRYLQYADGRPFFYLGDTAWELFHRTTREEARLCLEDRARKGFTVIQAVCLAERDGLRVPNAYGDLPFADAGFTRPNERYFTYVDEVVAMADSLGLVIGLLPAWGDKFCLKWGPGPEIFTTEGRAEAFGRYLGERYRIRRNIIWILGGDRPPEGREPILRAFARGIACGVAGREDYSACLITYHPWGKSSSGDWLHDEPWLAFNMQQNGHAYDFDLWERIARDYARRPVKPVLDGEPIYEEHPIDFDREKYGTSEALHVRRAFYHEVFSGACGHTYGCHAVWQMWEPGRYAPVTGPVRSWRESLSLPGAYQVCYGRELIESRPFFRRIPDQGVIAGDAGRGHGRCTATRDSLGTYAMVYSESGRPFAVDLGRVSGKRIVAWWYDVRSGRPLRIGEFRRRDAGATMTFTPPTCGKGNDWVLVLDDARMKYPPPGRCPEARSGAAG